MSFEGNSAASFAVPNATTLFAESYRKGQVFRNDSVYGSTKVTITGGPVQRADAHGDCGEVMILYPCLYHVAGRLLPEKGFILEEDVPVELRRPLTLQ